MFIKNKTRTTDIWLVSWPSSSLPCSLLRLSWLPLSSSLSLFMSSLFSEFLLLWPNKDERFMCLQARTLQLSLHLGPQKLFSIIHSLFSTSHIVHLWTSALPFPITAQGATVWFVNVTQCQDAVKSSYVSSTLTASSTAQVLEELQSQSRLQFINSRHFGTCLSIV